MKKNSLYRFLLSLSVLLLPFTIKAQTNADNLFLQGQKLQKTMTVASQNAAIKKFQAAKVLYTTASKKSMCDNQISACNTNISNIKGRKTSTTSTGKAKGKADKRSTADAEKPVPVAKKRDVTLSLSETRLDFKCNPKEGSTQSVNVTCNFDDWTIAKKPEWLTVYTAKDKFSVEVEENATEEDRSGIITVKCDDKEVDLIVNQDRAKTVDKIIGGVKGIFKKKKK